MSEYSSFLETTFPPQNPINDHLNTHSNDNEINYQSLELLDLMLAAEEDLEKIDFTSCLSQSPYSSQFATNNTTLSTQDNPRRDEGGQKRMKMEMMISGRIAFRTKSSLEIMDDGFHWRKYGKKSVKNNPNPRNYYRCSNQGCDVKKRVERDGKDSSYVITTYEGVHNHQSPSVFSNNTDHQSITNLSKWTPQPLHNCIN